MRGVTKGLLGVLAAAAVMGLTGCNSSLDDPFQGEGILSIEKIEPATVKADITPTDPNGLPTPLTNDDVKITVKNRPRTKGTSPFSDVVIEFSERVCLFGGNPIATGIGAGGVTIASGSTADITTTAVTVGDKMTSGALGDSWTCFVRFRGKDIGGNPVTSDSALFIVNFVDE